MGILFPQANPSWLFTLREGLREYYLILKKKKKKSETDSSYSRRGWGWSPQDFLAPEDRAGWACC